MIDITTINSAHSENGQRNIDQEKTDDLFNLIKLIVCVIPVAYIFRCKDINAHVRLIIITDQYQYQSSDQTKTILKFIALGNSNIHVMCFCYGTMIDFLQRGHLFFSANCISGNCIYRRKGLDHLSNDSNPGLADVKEKGLKVFNQEIKKVSDFFSGAELYARQGKLNMAAFMLHQTIEQLYRLISLVFRGKDLKSHLLELLRKETAFYFPEIYNVFHTNERNELKWISLLQASYLGARYQNNYCITLRECDFLIEKVQLLILKVNTGLHQAIL